MIKNYRQLNDMILLGGVYVAPTGADFVLSDTRDLSINKKYNASIPI